MFFSGLLSSLLGWFIFNNLEESPFFKEQQKQKAAGTITATQSPVKLLFSSSYRNVLLLNLLITFGGGAGYYLTSGYLPSFLKVVNGVPNSVSSLILMGASVVALVSAVLFGAVSDLIGRKKTFLLVGVCMAGAAAGLLSRPGEGNRHDAPLRCMRWRSPSSAMPATRRS